MKIFISSCHRNWLTCLFVFAMSIAAEAQNTAVADARADSSETTMNMDASYDRPFLTTDKMPVAMGGYLEANTIYSSEDGLSEGLSFQARRLTIFLSSSISSRINFLSEIEFEEGGKEIAIEFAAMDVSLLPMLNFRAGIFMNPIGAFNQNHDGPKWELVERPDVAVNVLPATWSNAGFGLFGKTHRGDWIVGYEAYLSNGFDDSIIDNELSRTSLPESKKNAERFEESNNGKALFSGKVAIKNRRFGELGFSYMGGVFNKFEEDGLTLDVKRRVDVFAIDIHTTIKRTGTYIVGEAVYVLVDVPATYTQQFGKTQQGFFLDVVQPIMRRNVLSWDDATLNIAARLDYVDWNVGTFVETGSDIGEYLWAITPAVSFRPTSQTVIRLNYRYHWQTDILNNPAAKTASWLFGFSTYF